MKLFQIIALCVIFNPATAFAGWNNVFQFANGGGSPPAPLPPGPPPPNPPSPGPVSPNSAYVLQPVTTYRLSWSVDPNTGCSTQIQVPVVTYQWRLACPAITESRYPPTGIVDPNQVLATPSTTPPLAPNLQQHQLDRIANQLLGPPPTTPPLATNLQQLQLDRIAAELERMRGIAGQRSISGYGSPQATADSSLPPIQATLKAWVPSLKYDDEELKTIIEDLKIVTQTLSPDKNPINFIWLVPRDVKLDKVTFKSGPIPLGEALKYLGEVANVEFRADDYAIVVRRRPIAPELIQPSGNPLK